MNNYLSIIIPVYNGESSIKLLLDSIFIQDHNFIKEVIIVNDGSTDNTIGIIENYNNPKIVLINKTHTNAGDSRNYGLAKATGIYIWFVDSDDRIPFNALDIINQKLKKSPNISILEFSYLLYDEKNDIMKDAFPNDQYIFSNCNDAKGHFITIQDYPILLTANAYPWNKIYNLDFIRSNKLTFSNTIVHNDLFFKISSEIVAKNIAFINQALYIHYINKINGQLTQQRNSIRVQSLIKALNDTDFFIAKHNINKFVKLHYLLFKFNIFPWAFTLVEKENDAYKDLNSFYIKSLNNMLISELLYVYNSKITSKQSRKLINNMLSSNIFPIQKRVILKFYKIYKKFNKFNKL